MIVSVPHQHRRTVAACLLCCCPLRPQRNHTSLVLIVGASVLLPALVILGVAWGSGYMSHLYSNTMSSLR